MKYLIVCSAFLLNYSVVIQAHPETTSEIMQELTDMTMYNSIISLDRTTFNKYVNNPKKDYSFFIIFTSSSTQCHRCTITTEEFLLVANSFKKNSPSYNHNLFFGRVDIAHVSEIPQDLRQTLYLPSIVHYPAKNEQATMMDIQNLGSTAENIAKWIQDRANIKIRIYRPGKFGIVAIIFLFLFWFCFLIIRKKHLKFLYSKLLWASEAVLFCLVMTSGHIWNQINGAPYYRATKTDIAIFCEFNCQFVFESYIVLFLNFGIVFAMIIVIESAGGVKKRKTAYDVCTVAKRYPQRIKYVAGMIAVQVLFSLLMFAFRMKLPQYPYKMIF